MSDSILVVLSDPTKSLYDRDSGFRLKGDYVSQITTNPFPSQRVKEWFKAGAIREVKAEDVKFFYSRAELNQLSKPQIVPIASDWSVPLEIDGKEKSRAQLIDDLVKVIGER